MSDTKTNQRLARLIELQRELDLRKALYAEYDEIVTALAADGFKCAEFENLWLELKDNFASSNTVFRVAGVKRYEMFIDDPAKVRARAEKRARKGA